MTTKVLVMAKTYPTLSSKYGELVCTAGITDRGDWIRIYPVPFRRLQEYHRFPKYSWIDIPLEKNHSDPRPESYRPLDLSELKITSKLDTSNKWMERKDVIFSSIPCCRDMAQLIEKAHTNELSLALFKPNKVLDFVWEKTEPSWDKKKLNDVLADLKQGDLFYHDEFIEDFRVADKLPYKFSYIFNDITGKQRRLMIEDWEVGALYWNCRRGARSDEQALEKVRQKYFDTFVGKTDLHFYLGTTKQHHIRKSRNPFVIIGTFTPPLDNQMQFGF